MSDNHVNLADGSGHKLETVLREVDTTEARHLLEVWHVIGPDPPGAFPSADRVDAARRAILAATADSPQLRRAADRPARHGRRLLWPAAAAVVISAVVLFWWVRPTTIEAPHGEQVTVDLDDGSRVYLNSGSSVRFRTTLGALAPSRSVRLHGEAYFDISASAEPFVVNTFNATVSVLGTRFNVRAWADVEASTFVAVESGRVRVTSSRGDDVLLSAGESVRIASGADSAAVHVADALAWRQGDLVYKDRMLGAILDDIHRRFDVAVELDPAVPETTRLSLAHRNPADAESVIRDLAAGLHLRYRARSNGLELFRP